MRRRPGILGLGVAVALAVGSLMAAVAVIGTAPAAEARALDNPTGAPLSWSALQCPADDQLVEQIYEYVPGSRGAVSPAAAFEVYRRSYLDGHFPGLLNVPISAGEVTSEALQQFAVVDPGGPVIVFDAIQKTGDGWYIAGLSACESALQKEATR